MNRDPQQETSVDKLVIRHLADGDFDLWAPLWTEYLAFYETSRTQELFEHTFARLVDSKEDRCEAFIALQDRAPAGVVHCIYHLHLWQEEQICYLQDLIVNDHFRNQGIARQLIERVYERADERGMKGVYWQTQEFNTTARYLYDKVAVLSPFVRYSRD